MENLIQSIPLKQTIDKSPMLLNILTVMAEKTGLFGSIVISFVVFVTGTRNFDHCVLSSIQFLLRKVMQLIIQIDVQLYLLIRSAPNFPTIFAVFYFGCIRFRCNTIHQ